MATQHEQFLENIHVDFTGPSSGNIDSKVTTCQQAEEKLKFFISIVKGYVKELKAENKPINDYTLFQKFKEKIPEGFERDKIKTWIDVAIYAVIEEIDSERE